MIIIRLIKPLSRTDRYTCLIDLYNETSSRILITTYRSIFYKIPTLNEISNSWIKISKQSNYNEIIEL